MDSGMDIEFHPEKGNGNCSAWGSKASSYLEVALAGTLKVVMVETVPALVAQDIHHHQELCYQLCSDCC
jgi:hypothetical protein